MKDFKSILSEGKDVAFVIRKGALSTDVEVHYQNANQVLREEIIQHIVMAAGSDSYQIL